MLNRLELSVYKSCRKPACIGGTQFSFANVYMSSHSGARRATLCKQLQHLLPANTIMGGDFNMVQDPTLDMRRPPSVKTPYDNGGWQEMLDMQTHLGLSDLWREANGDLFFHTHSTAVQGGHTLTRIDYALGPSDCSVGPWALTAGHDHLFWQGTEWQG